MVVHNVEATSCSIGGPDDKTQENLFLFFQKYWSAWLTKRYFWSIVWKKMIKHQFNSHSASYEFLCATIISSTKMAILKDII